MTDRLHQAQKAINRLLELYPASRLAEVKELFPVRRADDLARWELALLKAGLPE